MTVKEMAVGDLQVDGISKKSCDHRQGSILPLAVDAKGLSRIISLGVRTIRQHDAAGKLPAPIRIGGRVVWRVDEIRAWLEAGSPSRADWEAIKASHPK